MKNGERVWILWRTKSIRDSHGNIVGNLATGHDITLLEQIEEDLRITVSYTRSLIEANLDPLMAIDPGGKITDVNTATENITGYSRAQILSTDFTDYFTDPEKVRVGHRALLEKGFVRDYELDIKHRDGNITQVLYNASVYVNEAGQVIGILAAARDITERKRVEELLLRESLAQERLNTALKELLNNLKNDMQELGETIKSNVKTRVIPYVERLRQTNLDAGQAVLAEIIERAPV